MKNQYKVLSYVILTLSAYGTPVFANQCTKDSGPIFLSKDSKAFATQQASHTWEDWIWRGPVFKCPSTGTSNCTYMWGEAKTTGYTWGVGVTLNLDKLPVIGEINKVLSLVSLNAKYDQQQTFTTNYSWNVQMMPGYYAQPIQVVVRRWTTGQYRGAIVRDKSVKCAMPSLVYYRWDGNAVAGRWTANIESSRYASYNIHR